MKKLKVIVTCSDVEYDDDIVEFAVESISSDKNIDEDIAISVLESALAEYYAYNDISLREAMRDIKREYKITKEAIKKNKK